MLLASRRRWARHSGGRSDGHSRAVQGGSFVEEAICSVQARSAQEGREDEVVEAQTEAQGSWRRRLLLVSSMALASVGWFAGSSVCRRFAHTSGGDQCECSWATSGGRCWNGGLSCKGLVHWRGSGCRGARWSPYMRRLLRRLADVTMAMSVVTWGVWRKWQHKQEDVMLVKEKLACYQGRRR